MNKYHWPLYAVLGVFGVAVFCFSFFDIYPLLELILPSIKINITTIIDLILSLGAWGPFVSIGLMILHSFVPFPAEFLTIANGIVFGPFWGCVITWVGAMLGAFISFGLTKLYGRPFVEKIVSASQLKKLDLWIQNQGTTTLLLCRFIPLISFNLINYGAGMTKISWWTFTWTTGIGILPVTIIMVNMGYNINIIPWWAWLILLIFFLGTGYFANSLQGEKHRQ